MAIENTENNVSKPGLFNWQPTGSDLVPKGSGLAYWPQTRTPTSPTCRSVARYGESWRHKRRMDSQMSQNRSTGTCASWVWSFGVFSRGTLRGTSHLDSVLHWCCCAVTEECAEPEPHAVFVRSVSLLGLLVLVLSWSSPGFIGFTFALSLFLVPSCSQVSM